LPPKCLPPCVTRTPPPLLPSGLTKPSN
jgi:hypothetical protein